MSSFDLEENRLKKEIVEKGAKKVLLQLPEGLKFQATRLASIIEEAGATPLILAEPCYGACDLALEEAKALKADLIVHYGHSPLILQSEVPTLYLPAKAKIRIMPTIRKASQFLENWNKIGLVTTVQHVHVLEKVRKALLDAGKVVVIGDASKTASSGQVLGCDFSNAQAIAEEVEAFLFFGGGRFHAIGVALSTGKPVVIADPYLKQAYQLKDEVNRILRQRWASISKARKAENFGILIGLKVGQRRFKKALEIKKKLEETDKKAFLVALREITPERLMQFPSIDAYVNTACPRLSLDDAPRFKKPLLTPRELQVMLGELSWEEVCRKGWFENEI